jgi:thiamine biosynthesis lipoprotein
MGTVIRLTAWGEDDEGIVRAFRAAFDEFDRVDRVMTTWTPDSEVSRINKAAGRKRGVRVAKEVITVLEKAAWASRLTQGAFDITVGSFSGLWKFDQDKDGTLPSAEAVESRRKLVGWRDVLLDVRHDTVRLRKKGQRITLGGIAKGYAVDRAVAILYQHGLVHFLVQAGGDLYVAGRRGDRAWKVGIRDPRGDAETFFAIAEVQDHTFSTSGDYERFVIKDGKRYHHILDPKTGYPAWRSRSVTVMAKDAITADALSTALFVLGPEAGLPLVETLPDVEAVFVGADNRLTVSSGLKDKLVVEHPPTDGL